MAQVPYKYLSSRLGKKNVSGRTYQEVIDVILENQSKDIVSSVSKLEESHWKNVNKKIRGKEKNLLIPDISKIMNESINVIKTAEKGKLLRDSIREDLTNAIRETITEHKSKGEEPKSIIRGGRNIGVINHKVIPELESKIRDVFKGYTKIDPQYGMPTNIHTIAVTETRSAINNTKRLYVKKLNDSNPDVSIRKIWRQNKKLSKNYRRGHDKVNGMSLPLGEMFPVPMYKRDGKKWVPTGEIEYMESPHDYNASAENVICCNCDIIYKIKRGKK